MLIKDIPVYKLSLEMFGNNDNNNCRLIKKLLRHYLIEDIGDNYWSRITDTTLKDDCGWLIPINCLT